MLAHQQCVSLQSPLNMKQNKKTQNQTKNAPAREERSSATKHKSEASRRLNVKKNGPEKVMLHAAFGAFEANPQCRPQQTLWAHAFTLFLAALLAVKLGIRILIAET